MKLLIFVTAGNLGKTIYNQNSTEIETSTISITNTTAENLSTTTEGINIDVCEEDGLFPSSDNCEEFYSCYNGTKNTFHCPDGLHFSSSLNRCDWPETANCTVKKLRNSESCMEDGIYASEENCNEFYYCSNGIKIHEKCPAELHFNKSTKQCDWPENAKCSGAADSLCVKNGDNLLNSIYPSSQNCDEFFYCSNGQAIIQKCQPGLYYNPDLKQCDWPANVDCSEFKSSGLESFAMKFSEEKYCDGLANGIYPSEENCSEYFFCSNGIRTDRKCPQGLVYNPLLLVCDWPENVDC